MKTLLTVSLGLLSLSAFAAPTTYETAVGKWRTIDDKTNQPKSIVQVYEKDGLYYGKVIKSLDPKGPKNCQNCPGEFKDKPIVGMRVMWGFKEGHYSYTSGKVIDPETGDVYSGTMKLKDDGKILQLRGYIGIPMFGRSQTWERIIDEKVTGK